MQSTKTTATTNGVTETYHHSVDPLSGESMARTKNNTVDRYLPLRTREVVAS